MILIPNSLWIEAAFAAQASVAKASAFIMVADFEIEKSKSH
jgi:hypothetical protein